jgi:hypothetical protein
MLRNIVTGFIALGWSVATAATQPSLVSVSPAVSSGSNQTLTVIFNAPGGYQTLDVLNVLINNFLDGRQACYLAYSRSSNALYVVADNGDASQISGKVMDGTGTISNSQCSVALSGSSASGTGNTLTLMLSLTFSASFSGNKVIYAAARDLSQNNSGWNTMGVHNVPGAAVTYPNPVGMNPSSGNTQTQTLTFTYQDQTSATNLQTVWALINTALDGRAACYVAYYRPGNQLYLIPDNGDGSQATSILLSSGGTLSNSQCSVSAQGASAQTSGNTLTVTLPITFTNAFAGFEAVWMAAQTLNGAQTSPWQALGAWSVPAQAAQGTPVITTSPPTSTTSGGTFSLQLPLLNIGTGDAAGFQLTAVTLGTLSPNSPALPVAIGTLAAGGSTTLNLNFNSATLTVGTDYLLTLQGAYQSAGTAQPFLLYRIVTYGAPDIYSAPANPVTVTPTLDTAHAATQIITAASGGTITATGADGSVFTLVLPANAILTDKPITMTPISSLAGVPSGSTFAAGVQLEPDGMALQQPATLTIQPATSIPAGQQSAFTYSGSGQDFHPYPLQLTTGLTLQVLHFSGPHVGKRVTFGTPIQLPTTPLGRFEAVAGDLVSQILAAQHANQNTDALYRQLAGEIQRFFDTVLMPDAKAAVNDPSQVDQAVQEFLTCRLFSSALSGTLRSQILAELNGLSPTIAQAITNAYNGYFNACISQSSFGGVTGRIALGSSMAHENDQYRRLYDINFPNYLAQLRACLIGSLQANVDLEANGQEGNFQFDLKVSAPNVPLDLNQGLLSFNQVSFSKNVPIQYSQPMQVSVIGVSCGSQWQWSQDPYPSNLGIGAVLDRDQVKITTSHGSVYIFQVTVIPVIKEHYVEAEFDGVCTLTSHQGTMSLFTGLFDLTFGAAAQNGGAFKPIYVTLNDQSLITEGLIVQTGEFDIKATLIQTSQ